MNMACYKSALIDLDSRWANKGQDMKNESKFEKGNRCIKDPFFKFQENEIDKLIDFVIKDAFEGLSDTDPWSVERSIRAWFKSYQPDRLRRVDTSNSEAIVGSANIDEIAELNRND